MNIKYILLNPYTNFVTATFRQTRETDMLVH